MENEVFYPRQLSKTIAPWLKRKEGVLIFGARQVGKSTFLKKILAQKFPMAKFLSFDDEETLKICRENPQGALQQALLVSSTIFIDEFQKIPAITTAIKYLIDNHRPAPKFFLSGSVSDTLFRGGESMVGRIVRLPLYSFSFREYLRAKNTEINQDVDLKKIEPAKWQMALLGKSKLLEAEMQDYLLSGGYPATLTMASGQKNIFWENQRTTFLEKDIWEILRSGQKQSLSNLAVILAKRVGFPLSLNGLANELGIDLRTVKKLLDILSLSYWIETIYPQSEFGSEFKRKFKVYFLDNGLRNFLSGTTTVYDFESGPLFENGVFGILKRFFKYRMMEGKISFWRTYGGGEVDFVLEHAGARMVIEVKAGKMSKTEIPLSLKNFIKKYKIKKAIVINRNFYKETEFEGARIYFLPLYVLGLLE